MPQASARKCATRVSHSVTLCEGWPAHLIHPNKLEFVGVYLYVLK